MVDDISLPAALQPHLLEELVAARMPFGRFAGQRLIELPEGYLVWFQSQGFPSGKLGQQMAAALEIKHNGLMYLLEPLLDPLGKPRLG